MPRIGPEGRARLERALARLQRGEPLYEMPNGQWRFGSGNKFQRANVVARLPIEFSHTNNRGWRVWMLKPDAMTS